MEFVQDLIKVIIPLIVIGVAVVLIRKIQSWEGIIRYREMSKEQSEFNL